MSWRDCFVPGCGKFGLHVLDAAEDTEDGVEKFACEDHYD